MIPETAGAPVLARLTRKAAVDKAADGSFSGVWLWAREGQTIASGAMSEADREKGTDNTLDDTIGKFLPDDPNAHVASKVTVRTSRRIGSN